MKKYANTHYFSARPKEPIPFGTKLGKFETLSALLEV